MFHPAILAVRGLSTAAPALRFGGTVSPEKGHKGRSRGIRSEESTRTAVTANSRHSNVVWPAMLCIFRIALTTSSRQRHLQSKRLASQSAAAMAEILGIPVSQIPTPSVSGSASPAPTEVIVKTEEDGEPKRDAEKLVSTSTMSVSDYFRQKLREKTLARQAATGIATPLPDMPAPDVKPSSEWEGSKVKFEEDNVKLETLGGYELTAPEEAVSTVLSSDSPIDDERAAKKARKAARAAKKEAKDAIKTEIVKLEPADHAVAAESSRDAEKAAKKAAKEQRKLEKAEKKRKRED